MFLIEIAKGQFIDAEKIDYIDLSKDVRFTLSGEIEGCYVVEKNYRSTFVNNLQALNQNIVSVEKCYYNLKDAEEE
jgi:hypothetical protein|tara:strand:- start:928 stop:1155 length:228 start_codon:yes stop_codon:yes gene_type:complete